MKKNIFFIVAAIGIAVVNVNLSLNSHRGLSNFVVLNVEALSGENPMDSQVWYVHASSSTAWTCTKPGTSACPAP